MTVDTIFGSDGSDKNVTTAPAKTEDQGLLPALVGEKQKYKSVEELAKAYVNADAFIEQLKEENRKLREKETAARTIDDVLERMNKKDDKPADTPANTSQLTKDDVAALVEQTLTGRETARTREQNLLQADKLMKEKFGEKAAEVFKTKATSPELTKVYMELASVSPHEFVAVFAPASAQPTGGTVATGSVNTTTVVPTSNREALPGTKEWANKVRKEKPDEYWSLEFQTKLQRMAIENPNLYFGG